MERVYNSILSRKRQTDNPPGTGPRGYYWLTTRVPYWLNFAGFDVFRLREAKMWLFG